MRVSPLPPPRKSRSRLRAHQNSSFPRDPRPMPTRNGPPRRFLKSRSSARRSRATTRSLAHIVRAPRGRGEQRILHSSAFGTRRTPHLCRTTRRWKLASGMMSGALNKSAFSNLGTVQRSHRADGHQRRKAGAPWLARETSGRRRTFVRPNRRGSASRAGPSPFLCQTVVALKPSSGEMEAFGRNQACIGQGIKPPTQDPSREMPGVCSRTHP